MGNGNGVARKSHVREGGLCSAKCLYLSVMESFP